MYLDVWLTYFSRYAMISFPAMFMCIIVDKDITHVAIVQQEFR